MLKDSSVKLGEMMADTNTAKSNNCGATETSRLSSLCDLSKRNSNPRDLGQSGPLATLEALGKSRTGP